MPCAAASSAEAAMSASRSAGEDAARMVRADGGEVERVGAEVSAGLSTRSFTTVYVLDDVSVYRSAAVFCSVGYFKVLGVLVGPVLDRQSGPIFYARK